MEARAKARHVRVSARKARIVVDLVRGQSVEKGIETLRLSTKAVARPIEKIVVSAMHNLAGQFEHPVEPSEMKIKEIFVNEGRTMYRIRPRAQGRAYRIRKRSSSITVVVDYQGELEAGK
jgi:large subunit ribosomal protein L22